MKKDRKKERHMKKKAEKVRKEDTMSESIKVKR